MVKNFTANEIGDVVMARLKEPYNNAIRVLDYDIVVGVTAPQIKFCQCYQASTMCQPSIHT